MNSVEEKLTALGELIGLRTHRERFARCVGLGFYSRLVPCGRSGGVGSTFTKSKGSNVGTWYQITCGYGRWNYAYCVRLC